MVGSYEALSGINLDEECRHDHHAGGYPDDGFSNNETIISGAEPIVTTGPETAPGISGINTDPLNSISRSIRGYGPSTELHPPYMPLELERSSWLSSAEPMLYLGTETSSTSLTSSVYSDETSREEKSHRLGQQDSLEVRCSVHTLSESSFELLFSVRSIGFANKEMKAKANEANNMDADERGRLNRYADDAFAAIEMENLTFSRNALGTIALASKFMLGETAVTACLFEKAIVVVEETADGFTDLVGMFRFHDERTKIVYVEGRGMVLENSEVSLPLYAEHHVLLVWMASLDLPHMDCRTGLSRPLSCARDARSIVVICTPIRYVQTILPPVLQNLGPEDELGLVVATLTGTLGTIAPYKPSWSGWVDLIQFDLESLDVFQQASVPLLEAAAALMKGASETAQRSIILVSGCPLASTVVTIPTTLHVVGVGHLYDVDFLSGLAQKSLNGSFHHADTAEELGQCCAGLTAAFRTYTHRDLELHVMLSPDACVVTPVSSSKPRTGLTSSKNAVIFRLGSLINGQTRAVTLAVESKALQAGDILASYTIKSMSVVSGCSQAHSSQILIESEGSSPISSGPMMFERMVFTCADLLREGLRMALEGSTRELLDMLARAARIIERTSDAASKFPAANAQQLHLLEQPDLSYEYQIVKSKHLAYGLLELTSRLRLLSECSMSRVRAVLLEARSVIDTQCAVTRRTYLERLFFEPLACNRF